MAASKLTVEHLAEVLQKYVPGDLIVKVCLDLEKVDGNVSFCATRDALVALLRSRA